MNPAEPTVADQPDACLGQPAEGRGAARDGVKAKFAGDKPGDLKKAIDGPRQVSALLEAKAPDYAPAFKSWLQAITQRVAEAAKERGSLGLQRRPAERLLLLQPDYRLSKTVME